MPQEPYFTTLKNRGQIIISGKDNKSFLQKLISNDINLLNTENCIYSCLLTPQGKFLYDFFITISDGNILLDCEGNERAQDLGKLLNMYKLRADITVKITENINIYAVIGSNKYGHKDPRHKNIGYRSYIKPDISEKNFEHWDHLRISLTVPDGNRDMIPNKSTLLECNIDKLSGLSYDKGCYIGQELTARMHYRGLAKKHLCTITLADIDAGIFPVSGQTINKNGKLIGEMRSSCGDLGIALIKSNAIT